MNKIKTSDSTYVKKDIIIKLEKNIFIFPNTKNSGDDKNSNNIKKFQNLKFISYVWYFLNIERCEYRKSSKFKSIFGQASGILKNFLQHQGTPYLL